MFHRHDLVWLNTRGWQVAIAHASAELAPRLWRWRERDWPLIVRSQEADLGPDELDLEVILPPKAPGDPILHAPVRTVQQGVAKVQKALSLREVLPSLPESVASVLATLTEGPGPELHVAGVLALQALTGQAYVDSSTPVEFILRPNSKEDLEAGLKKLTAHAGLVRRETEIMFPTGHAVTWEEWRATASGRTHLMTRDLTTVRLMHVKAILTSLA